MSTTYEEQRTEQEKRIDADVLARVKRGLAWLEETHGPGWEDKVDLATLRLEDADACVLGQVYADDAFEDGLDDGFEYAEEVLRCDPVPLGFDEDWSTPKEAMKVLQEAWEFVLRPRVTEQPQ